MTAGYQKSNSNNVDVIVLLDAAAAANTVAFPSATFAAVPAVTELYDLTTYKAVAGAAAVPDKGHIVIRSTAGSGAMTLGACRVIVGDKASGKAGPYGVGADATKGMLNNGAGFGETSTDGIYHREEIAGLSTIDGIQVQLGAFGGTAPAFTVELILPKFGPGVVA